MDRYIARCGKCGANVPVYVATDGDGELGEHVDPCPTCIEMVYHKGLRDGARLSPAAPSNGNGKRRRKRQPGKQPEPRDYTCTRCGRTATEQNVGGAVPSYCPSCRAEVTREAHRLSALARRRKPRTYVCEGCGARWSRTGPGRTPRHCPPCRGIESEQDQPE